METPSTQDAEKPAAALDGAATRRGGSPVLVTRGETHRTNQLPTESTYEGEKILLKRGQGGYLNAVFQPIPDKAKSPTLAHIDWLAFTIHPAEGRDWLWLRSALADIYKIPESSWKGTNRKWSGYQHRVDLINPIGRGESINLGLVAYGGESQRGTMHVSLNGTACSLNQDWQLIHDWCETVSAAITRVDVAHDDFEGTTFNIKKAKEWYAQKGFSFNGRPPTAELIDDLDSGQGKTFYVGNRANGKLIRIYEKGKKEGDPDSDWCRVEVEWRNKNRVIPLDVIITPGEYLAGAYPCLSQLSKEQKKIKTIQKAATINYDATVKWARSTVGKTMNAMLKVENGNKEAVFDQLIREGVPKRLEPYLCIPNAINRKKHEDVKP